MLSLYAPFYWIDIVLGLLALVPVGLRWLRVAQREHYIAPWTTRLGWLWYSTNRTNLALAIGAILVALASIILLSPPLAALAIVWVAFLPIGLGVKGRSAKLAWTPRLKRLAVVSGILIVLIGAILTLLFGSGAIALTLLFAAPIVDIGLRITAPIEKRMSRRFLLSARKRLDQVRPRIVAITGSYGKTSTKGYVAQVLAGQFATVASPASFNNLMGLSRAVNERVVPGTEVFVAEMGIYGVGEIRELSESFPPDVAAITVIGEAHLARMGSRETIFQAKSEITERAKTVVLPIDDPLLAGLAERNRSEGKRVITVSTVPGTDADVVVDGDAGIVSVRENGGVVTAPVAVPGAGHAVNIAVTVGIAVAMDMPLAAIAPRLEALPDAPHRAEVQIAASGVAILDDTYNANPVGAERALEAAAELAAERGGPLVVVTPGMVELGTVQAARNEAFAASVARRGGTLFAIARVNRAALVRGAQSAGGTVRTFDTRDAAVSEAVQGAGQRGVILYENDLPDHYP
jgi:UDP-N-acetylmuramoyl-tripeptide--D-alanyl-D-alanine ligase